MIYLYAIGDPQADFDGICEGDLEAFVNRGVTRVPAPDEDALVRHDRMVSALAESGALLPVRFGAVMPGEDALRELLTERGDELRARLEHVRGRVEMGVRSAWLDTPPTRQLSGRDFMRARLERRRAARRAADELHPALADLSVDSVLTLCPREDTMFSAAYLVERADARRFSERAKGVTVTGPWPPYSFSG